MHDGYWFKDTEDIDYTYIKYDSPKPTNWPVNKMYGVSLFRMFIGVIRLGVPNHE